MKDMFNSFTTLLPFRVVKDASTMTNEERACELSIQIFGDCSYSYRLSSENNIYNELYALELVKAGLPNGYIQICPYMPSIEDMYYEAKKEGKLPLVKAIEDAGYLDVPANIKTNNAKLAIEKGFYTKEQLIRCHPEKAKFLTSDNALKAIEEGLLDVNKLYQLNTNLLEEITTANALKAIKLGITTFEELVGFRSAYNLRNFLSSEAVEKAIEASNKIVYFSIKGDLDAVEKALAEKVSPNTNDNFNSPLILTLISSHPAIAHLLIKNGGYFNHNDFIKNERSHPLFFNIIERELAAEEVNQAFSNFKPYFKGCEKEYHGFCLVEPIGKVASYNELSVGHNHSQGEL